MCISKVISKSIEKGMRTNGRSVDFIHRKMNCLRRITRYGSSLKHKPCTELKEVFSNMRFHAPRPRDVTPTAAHIMAVVALADADGKKRFALGLLLQWWLALRAMDVRGDYFRIKPGEPSKGGIVRGKFRWGDGLTWADVGPDQMCISKVISKTERHDARPVTFDLTNLPDIRARLAAIPERMGPVIVDEVTGMPYSRNLWRNLWRKYADLAGVPAQVQIRDARAGAITEANRMGATEEMTMHQGTHSNSDTTKRYIRNRDAMIADVIQLRTRTAGEP